MDQQEKFVKVPHTELAESTLTAVIQAFVLREGTDYGHQDFSMEQKVLKVLKQLESGKASLFYNLEEQSFDILAGF